MSGKWLGGFCLWGVVLGQHSVGKKMAARSMGRRLASCMSWAHGGHTKGEATSAYGPVVDRIGVCVSPVCGV